MKKAVFVFTLVLSVFAAKANQALGGEIGWTCQGNGQYVFEVVVYYDCSQTTSIPATNTLNWDASLLSIICTLADSVSISPDCLNATWAIACDTTMNFSPVKKYIYRSSPTTLSQTIPQTGWTFSTILANRFATNNTMGSNNFVLRAKMYPYSKGGAVSAQQCYDNAPKFAEKPRYAFSPTDNMFFIGGSDVDKTDSLFYDFAPSLTGTLASPVSITYGPSYAFNKPLPDTVQNSNNIPMSVLPVGQVYFKSQTTGRFTNCYKIESWRDGQKIAEVFQDFEIQINNDVAISGPCGGNPNLPPAVSLGWYANYDTLETYAGAINTYSLEVLAGDSIKFKLTSQDVDLQPSCVSQSITAMAKGTAMDFGSQLCSAAPCAEFNSLNAGGSFTSVLNNDVEFFWKTDTAHVDKATGRSVYWFYFSFEDSHCSLPGRSEVAVKVIVNRPFYAQNSQLALCAGDTVSTRVMGDTTNLSWSPSTGISCTNCANPMFYPTATTTYTATHSATGFSINVRVEVDALAPKPLFSQSGNDLVVGNASSYDTLVWARNNAPFSPQPNNTYTPWLSGDYWIQGFSGVCAANSDTFSYSFPRNLNANSTAGGEYNGTENFDKTYGMTIRLNNEDYYALDGFYVQAFDKNLQGANLANLSFAIYNQQQAKVFVSDSVTRVSSDILKFHGEFNLSTQEDYLLTFHVDTSIIVPTYTPSNWPVVASAGRIYVFNATKTAGNFYPATSATEYPFFHLSLKYGIGMSENAIQNVRFYPNPAKDVLHLESAGKVDYLISNALGQTLAIGSLETEKTLDISTWKSGFYIVNFTFENGVSHSEKLEILR